MTSAQLLNLLGKSLLASAALLVALAFIHHSTIETNVYFFDDLGNKVDYFPGRDVTFLLFSLAGVATLIGGFLLVSAKKLR